MKELVLTLVLLLVLPSVFSTYGVFCTSNAPNEIMFLTSNFENNGSFSIKLRNLTLGSIEVSSVNSGDRLVIEDFSKGLIGSGGDILISGTSSSGAYPLNEQFLLTYVNQDGIEREVSIACSGTPSRVGESIYGETVVLLFILSLVFLVLGAISLFYGYKKGKPKIKPVGFLLLILFIIAFLFAILLLFSNP